MANPRFYSKSPGNLADFPLSTFWKIINKSRGRFVSFRRNLPDTTVDDSIKILRPETV